MKRFFLSILLILALPSSSFAHTLEEAYALMEARSNAFQEQIVTMRTEGISNNTQDLVTIGIHNLRILHRSLAAVCAGITEGEDARARRENASFCNQHAQSIYALNKTLFKTSMQQDTQLKRTDLYEQRLLSFNEHLREILELFIFIRGTLTKVQKGIDGTAAKTFTR